MPMFYALCSIMQRSVAALEIVRGAKHALEVTVMPPISIQYSSFATFDTGIIGTRVDEILEETF